MGNFYSKSREKGGEETKRDEICNSSGVARQKNKYSDDIKQKNSSCSNNSYEGAKLSDNKQYANSYNEVSRIETDRTNADIRHGVPIDTERNNKDSGKTEIIETEIIIKPEIEINSGELVNRHREAEIVVEEDIGIIVNDDTGDKLDEAKQSVILLDEGLADVSEQESAIDLDQVLNGSVERSYHITFDEDEANGADGSTIIIDGNTDSVSLSPTIAFHIDVADLNREGAQTAIGEETEISVEQRFPLSFDINEISCLNNEETAPRLDKGTESDADQVHQSIPREDVIHVTDEEPEVVIVEDPYNAIRNDPEINLEDERDRNINEFEVTDSVVEPLTLRIDEEGGLSVVHSRTTDAVGNEMGCVPEITQHYVSSVAGGTEPDSEIRQTNINTDSSKNCRITLDSLEVRLSLTSDSYDSLSVDGNAEYDSSRYYTTIQENVQGIDPDVNENDNSLQVPKILDQSCRKRRLNDPDTSDYPLNTENFEENIGYGESEIREGSKKKKHKHKHNRHKHKHRESESLTS